MITNVLGLCGILFLTGLASAWHLPFYDLDEDIHSEIRNLLQNHLSGVAPVSVIHPREVHGWGPDGPIGRQVTGVAIDKDGNPNIFHRGNRVWNNHSFNSTNHFQERTAISEDVIITLDKKTGRILHSWGAGKFYLPHGITIDKNGNIWVTDVGLQQVLKFPPKTEEASLILGEKFQPGSDEKHFCKPTAVAIASKGDFFVSDGYCNARILHFNADGTLKGKYGHQGYGQQRASLDVPHGITLNEQLDLLCIADREHGRVKCIRAGLVNHDSFGEEVSIISDPNFVQVHNVAFMGNTLVGIATGINFGLSYGFTADVQNKVIIDEWQPNQEFWNPHGMAVEPNSESIYVTEIGPARVWKFVMEQGTRVY